MKSLRHPEDSLLNAGIDALRVGIEDWVDLGSAKRLQIDENDLWIAAQAKERDLIIVTGDTDMRIIASVDPDVRIRMTRT